MDTPRLKPEEAYRLAAWMMKGLNLEAEKAARLIEAADAAQRGEIGSGAFVENPFSEKRGMS